MPSVRVQVDTSAAKALLAKYRGEAMKERLRRATLAASQALVAPIASRAPVRSGRLRRSVRAWAPQSATGLDVKVGPTAPHAHLIINPHRIVTRGGRDTGRRTTGNPFVDAAVESSVDDALRIAADAIFES